MFHADRDGQTGMKNLIITLCSFANITKIRPSNIQPYLTAGSSYFTLLPFATLSMALLVGNGDYLSLTL